MAQIYSVPFTIDISSNKQLGKISNFQRQLNFIQYRNNLSHLELGKL